MTYYVTVAPDRPATKRQKEWLAYYDIAFPPDINRLAAHTLISTAKSKRLERPVRRRRIYPGSAKDSGRSHIRGYLTKAEFAGQIDKITKQITEELTGRFLRDAGKAYEALALARDDPDPKVRGEAVRAAIEHLNRVMGKVAEKQEHTGSVALIGLAQLAKLAVRAGVDPIEAEFRALREG